MSQAAGAPFIATPALVIVDGTTPAFKVDTLDPITGGFRPLECTIGAAGNFDTGQAELQILVAGQWHNTGVILDTTTTAFVIGPEAAPRGQKFRFNVSGGGGSLSISLEILAPMHLVLV